jgi:hypothetical protein
MIKAIIDLLAMDDYYGVSENIDIAKGINKKPSNWKAVKQIIKRHWKSKK